MPADVEFELDRRGVGELLRSQGVAAELTGRANRVAAAARGSAPRITGGYVASIDVETDLTDDRARARVTAHVPYALVVESRHRTLGAALDAAAG
jgi:hypothetical protein